MCDGVIDCDDNSDESDLCEGIRYLVFQISKSYFFIFVNPFAKSVIMKI